MALQAATNRGARRQLLLLGIPLQLILFVDGHIVHTVVMVLSVAVVTTLQSQSHTSCGVHGQVLFLLSVRLEVKSFAHGHIVHPVVIVLSFAVVMALQSQSPMSGVRSHLPLLSVCLELKSFEGGHIVRPVIVLDAITLVLVLQDATILVMALQTLTILEVDLQNVIGIALELHGTTVAVGILRNTDVPNVAIPTHLADGITLYLQNLDLLVIVVAVAVLLLELNSLAICLYPPAVLLHQFLDVNLDLLLSHQQSPEKVRLIRHQPPLVDHWRAQSKNQLSLKCRHVLKPPYGGLRRVCLTKKKSVLIPLQCPMLVSNSYIFSIPFFKINL